MDLQRSFVELGGDSMAAVELLDKLFETFGVDLSLDEFMQTKNMSDIVTLLATAGDH